MTNKEAIRLRSALVAIERDYFSEKPKYLDLKKEFISKVIDNNMRLSKLEEEAQAIVTKWRKIFLKEHGYSEERLQERDVLSQFTLFLDSDGLPKEELEKFDKAPYKVKLDKFEKSDLDGVILPSDIRIILQSVTV